jgi:hypothetical protein
MDGCSRKVAVQSYISLVFRGGAALRIPARHAPKCLILRRCARAASPTSLRDFAPRPMRRRVTPSGTDPDRQDAVRQPQARPRNDAAAERELDPIEARTALVACVAAGPARAWLRFPARGSGGGPIHPDG